LIRTVPCFVPSPVAENTRADLLAMVNERPALIYLVNDDEREMLGERAASAKGSPWGWRLLPLPGPFEEGKAMVAAQLRRLADLRDGAFAAMDKALAAM